MQRLHRAGIGFTITSSRPAIGMRFLIEPLALWLPVGPFNGSSIVDRVSLHPHNRASDRSWGRLVANDLTADNSVPWRGARKRTGGLRDERHGKRTQD